MRWVPLVLLLPPFGSCVQPPDVPLEVPSFAAGDPQTKTAGFVRRVRLVEREVGGSRYILMAYVVGETLTLGAMVQGAFAGEATFTLDSPRGSGGLVRLTMPFAGEPGAVPVPLRSVRGGVVDGEDSVFGQRAGFRGYRWVTVDLPAAEWLPRAGRRLGLVFYGGPDGPVCLPVEGLFFAAPRRAKASVKSS